MICNPTIKEDKIEAIVLKARNNLEYFIPSTFCKISSSSEAFYFIFQIVKALHQCILCIWTQNHQAVIKIICCTYNSLVPKDFCSTKRFKASVSKLVRHPSFAFPPCHDVISPYFDICCPFFSSLISTGSITHPQVPAKAIPFPIPNRMAASPLHSCFLGAAGETGGPINY